MIKKIDFAPGDTVRVSERIKEGNKYRIQLFEGVVLGIRGRGENKSFVVRKMVGSVAVEKIWPINSVNLDKVLVKEHSKKKIRRSKTYFLRKTI